MPRTPERGGSKPGAPRPGDTISAAGDRRVKFGSTTVTVHKNGDITLPTGYRITNGKINRPSGTGRDSARIELPSGEFLTFVDGQVVRNTPKAGNDKVTYRNPFVPGQVVSPINGQARNQGATSTPAAPPRALPRTPAAPKPATPTPPAPRGAQADPRIPSTPAPRPAVAPAGGRVPGAGAPAGAAAAPAGRPAAASTPVAAAGARPASAPAAPVGAARPAAPGARPAAAPAGSAVDKKVREMFGEVAAFLTDPELGPLLRKAAQEGWDATRLMGELQQTKFWKTKGDTERKWIILNKLDNATAKSQVQQQMQSITDLIRSEGVNLNQLQVHDLAVNVLKFGWSGSQVRENIFKAVPAAGLSTAVTQKYGYLAAFMSHPEVGPLLDRGAREGWDEGRLKVELAKTSWWKTTTESQRLFNAQLTQDPASAQQAITARQSQLLTTANGLGIRMDPARLKKIAEDSLRFGWDDTQIRQSLAAEYDFQGSEFGFAGSTSRTLKQLASDYLVPLSDAAMGKWTEDIVSGRVDEEGFLSYVKEQAKSLFPTLSAAIDRGVTVAQYAEPYRQIAAQTLEINPDDVDFTKPMYQRALMQVDPKTGERASMGLAEYGEYLRKQPQWQNTRQANERSAALSESILKTFGAVA